MSRVAIAALPRNQRTFGNSLRGFVPFLLAPLSNGFNLDRELRRPFPSAPQFAICLLVWLRGHAIADNSSPTALIHGKAPVAAASRGQSLEF